MALEDFNTLRRKKGIKVITLKDNDSLAKVALANSEDLLIITRMGQCTKINSDFNCSGRTASGVIGIRLADNDYVIDMLPIRHTTDNLAVFFEKGQGKQIKLEEFTLQNRGGKGVKLTSAKENYITCATLLEKADTIVAFGETSSICLSAKDIPILSRTAAGNSIIKNSKVISVSKL